MSDFFNEAGPTDTDNVSAGAAVIRAFKAKANSLLSQLFTATEEIAEFAVKVSQLVVSDDGKWLLGSQIQKSSTVDADRAIESDHIKNLAIISRTLAASAVTPPAVAHAPFAYQTATWEKDAVTDTFVVDAELANPVTALVDGARYWFKADVSNDAAPFLKLGTAAPSKSIVGPSGSTLSSGEIAAGQVVEVVYRANEDNFQMVSAASVAVNSSSSAFCVFNGTAEITQDVTLSSGSTVFNTAVALNASFTTGLVVAIYRKSVPGSDSAMSDIVTLAPGDPKYFRKISTTSFSLHNTKADAISGSNALTFTFPSPTTRTLSVRTIPVLDGFNVEGVVHNADVETGVTDSSFQGRPRPGSFLIVFSSSLASVTASISGMGSTTLSHNTISTIKTPQYTSPVVPMFDPVVAPSIRQVGVIFVSGGSITTDGTGVDPSRASVVVHAL